MEILDQHRLPTPLAETLGESASLSGLPRLVESIGCIAADPPEGAIISCPVLEACTGLGRHTIMPALRGLEEAGVIAQYKPEISAKPAGGKWLVSKTLCFELTELGTAVVPQVPKPDCKLRNPLLRPTPKQKKAIDCARCVMERTDKSGVVPPGAFTVKQVAECQNLMPETVRSTVADTLLKPGLVAKTPCGREPWGRGQTQVAYTPTPEGARWLEPIASPNCPAKRATKQQPASAIDLSPTQQTVVGALAEIKLAMASEQGVKAITQSAVETHTGFGHGTVNGVFQKLIKLGYLAKCTKPGSTKATHYELTARGLQLLLTHTDHRDALISANIARDSSDALAVFEQSRDVLIRVAQDVLSGVGIGIFWAEDIVNDSALRVYKRYVVKGTPVEIESHLVNVFRGMVRASAINFVRKECGTKNVTAGKKTVPLFYNDDDEHKLLAREIRLEKAMRRADPKVLVEDVILQTIEPEPTSTSAEFRDRLVTILAQMFLVMNATERDAALTRYAANIGEIKLSHHDWSQQVRPALNTGAAKASDRVIKPLREQALVDASPDRKHSKRIQKTELIKNIIIHQLENGDPEPAPPSQNLETMKSFIKQALYPTLTGYEEEVPAHSFSETPS